MHTYIHTTNKKCLPPFPRTLARFSISTNAKKWLMVQWCVQNRCWERKTKKKECCCSAVCACLLISFTLTSLFYSPFIIIMLMLACCCHAVFNTPCVRSLFGRTYVFLSPARRSTSLLACLLSCLLATTSISWWYPILSLRYSICYQYYGLGGGGMESINISTQTTPDQPTNSSRNSNTSLHFNVRLDCALYTLLCSSMQ